MMVEFVKWAGAAVTVILLIPWITAEVVLRLQNTLAINVAGTAALVTAVLIFVRTQARREQRAFAQFLEDRPIASAARSKEEARRAHFRRVTWSQLGSYAGLMVATLLGIAWRNQCRAIRHGVRESGGPSAGCEDPR